MSNPLRKIVMARSINLGHCVCNPRQGCPCDTFKNHNVCPCAGEKMPVRSGPVALTQLVRKAGCASKIGQADLKRILGKLPPVLDPNVLIGAAAGDDAGVYRINDELCLVQTVDVFTPCVDDPFLFGQIAAANSLSDVYAMGGRPLTALSIIGFPIDELDGSIMEAILRGGMEKLAEAKCSLIGGHSVQNEEILCGFAVTGVMGAAAAVARDNAKPGDVLVLTKPLGTGIVSFAAQIGRVDAQSLKETGEWMAALNKDAAELMIRFQAHACTDITGFGLMGHLAEMARNSGVAIELDMPALPVFAAVEACLAEEVFSGAIERNQEYSMAWVRTPENDDGKTLPILCDPQTSGGLLISLPEAAARELVMALRDRGNSAAAIVGRVKSISPGGKPGEVFIADTRLTHYIGRKPSPSLMPVNNESTASATVASAPEPSISCCDGHAGMPPTEAGTEAKPGSEYSGATADAFQAFLKQANRPEQLDLRCKKLIAIALSVSQRCKPCLASHMKTALGLGITQAEIDEAAWLGIAFAGSPAMMLYKEVCVELKRG
jgi:selenide,water dikinase